MAASLHGTIVKILNDRAISAPPPDAFILRDDGNGPYIFAWNVTALGARPTQAELDAVTDQQASDAERAVRFNATSRQKDVLATCAEIVRARGITAWNNMTFQQKKDATLAEADVWVTIRGFIEDNL